ncbi:unnamed protein product [Peniophora sp. CBMAI 1063]|nr:unnamed protein product [Peniophora sp. CBMAI 1063]
MSGDNPYSSQNARKRMRMRAEIAHIDRRWHDFGQVLARYKSHGIDTALELKRIEDEETEILEAEIYDLMKRDLPRFDYLWNGSFERHRCSPEDNGAIEVIEQYMRVWMYLELEARSIPGRWYTEKQLTRRLLYMLQDYRHRQIASTTLLYDDLRTVFGGYLQPLNRDVVSWLLTNPASPLTLHRKMRLVSEIERFYERVMTISNDPAVPMEARYRMANFSAFFGVAFILPPEYGFDVVPLVRMWARTVEGMVDAGEMNSMRLSMSATMWLHERRPGSNSKMAGRILPPPEMSY